MSSISSTDHGQISHASRKEDGRAADFVGNVSCVGLVVRRSFGMQMDEGLIPLLFTLVSRALSRH